MKEWVSVKDKLPSFNTIVNLRLVDGTELNGFLSDVNNEWIRKGYSVEFYFKQKVTHWQIPQI